MRKGQALVVVLLLLAVLVSVGLSVVSRSVTEVSLSNTEDESSRALSAAEAGVEAILNKTAGAAGATINVGVSADQETYSIVSKDVQVGNATFLSFPDLLKSGEGVTVNMVGMNPALGFDVCWGDPSVPNVPPGTQEKNPALEITIFYQSGGVYRTARRVWDPQNKIAGAVYPVPPPVNNDCPVDKTYATSTPILPIGGTGSPFGIGASDTLLFMRLTLLHNTTIPQYVAVGSGTASVFPSQGRISVIRGQSGQANRTINVFERTAEPLSVFDNALFAGTSIQ